MQLDMHFYGTYAMARAAGISPATARTIAHSDQYVDDALEDVPLELAGSKRFFLPVMTSHIPLDYRNVIPGNDQWRVWVCFHFLPGNQGNTVSERLVCRQGDDNNPAAGAILDFALEKKSLAHAPHLAGIISHVFQDTFAHYGFAGFSSDINKVDQESITTNVANEGIYQYVWNKAKRMWSRVMGSCAEISKLGHGAVASFPDRPYLSWSFRYENDIQPPVKGRNNTADFLEACRRQHNFFSHWARNNPAVEPKHNAVQFDTIADKVGEILAIEAPKQDRCEAWKEAIRQNQLFESVREDFSLAYDPTAWGFNEVLELGSEPTAPAGCNTLNFTVAAREFRNFVLGRLMPGQGLVYY